ncbi:hypothetical protein [Mucilaginibacter dorajii]|uniref:DinB-like domain-containing protein n=1 Tax=Mucilaginibacter dorajii TaxID=692994 RepID=A0ABP7P574_9SPHI|nr:hypothetical protein [Mucilaginibacter dorajii]MCS3734472.1 hypothetical protein [Mucilaginibacter dorajii]
MKNEIVTEYKGSLNMLVDTVHKCPDDLWESNAYENAYWRIVYHTLFYTAFYLSAGPAEFIPWDQHRANYHVLGSIAHDGQLIVIKNSYSKADLLNYASVILQSLEDAINEGDLTDTTGFDWIAFNRFGLHLYNIRHVQHHTGQLTERLHQVGIRGINWVR